jgi:hypothetical protein
MKLRIVFGLTLAIFWGTGFAQSVTTGIPVVRDGNGQVIGPVVDFYQSTGGTWESLQTVVFAGEIPVYVGVNRLGGFFNPGIFFQVHFLSDDCSGAPYLSESLDDDFDRVFNITAIREEPPGGLAIYVPAEGATLQTGLLIQSALQSDGVCISYPGGFTDDGIPAQRYQTPFAEPASPGPGPSIAQAGFAFAVPDLGPLGTSILVGMIMLLTLGAIRLRGAA